MIYGYGVALGNDNITAASTQRILDLLHLAPKYEKYCLADLHDCIDAGNGETIEDMSVEDVINVISHGEAIGIGFILREIIQEAEGIELSYESDQRNSSVDFLLLEPRMPWNWERATEKNLEQYELNRIFQKYIAVVSDCTDYVVDFHEVY